MLEHFSSRGVDIAFIDVAPQANDLGEPILLIHGFASNHRVNWVEPRWVETLAGAGRRVVAFDNRGHGQSEKLYLPADYRADLMTQDAANLLAHLRIGRADVMGYSMGARLASFLALYQPSLVRALILGGMGDRLVRDAGLPEAIAEAMEAPSLDSLADPTQRMFRAFADRTKSDRPRSPLASAARGGVSRRGIWRTSPSPRWSRSAPATPSPAIRACSPPCCRGERRSRFPAAITISRSATARSRPERSIFSPAENEPPPLFVIY
jgi:pimeloyl-ACP methyl ester carboxylesterase